MLPYLYGFSISHGRQFLWLGYNLDDSCVYLSWMRQAADGAPNTLNLFTTDPQHGIAPNPLFWTLGHIAGVCRLPLIAVYHLARLVLGFALLMLVWELIVALIANRQSQRNAFLFVCFSAGLGWLPLWWSQPLPGPIDTWQPEAITFLSLYLSPLFCFSMFLQVAVVYLLLRAQRTGSTGTALFAGLCGFLLGLTHTYDVITMAAIWLTYLVALTVKALLAKDSVRGIGIGWLQALLAGLITLPAVAYIAFQLKSEAVFPGPRKCRDAHASAPMDSAWIWPDSGPCDPGSGNRYPRHQTRPNRLQRECQPASTAD